MSDELVQYYVVPVGMHADGALALLAARGALLGQARWGDEPDFRRWRAIMMTKVVLEAAPDDFARVRAAPAALAMRADGTAAAPAEIAALVILPPQPRTVAAPLLGTLRLARKRRGRAPEPTAGPVLVLVAADDLGMHGGKLAAQAAHAAMHSAETTAHLPVWAAWLAAGAPLALRGADSATLAALAALYPGGAVHDAGFTQVASGSLTVVAIPPGAPDTDRLLRDLAPW